MISPILDEETSQPLPQHREANEGVRKKFYEISNPPNLIIHPEVKAPLQYLNEILTLLGEDRRKLPSLIVLFMGASMLDLAGLGLIAPYIGFVVQPD